MKRRILLPAALILTASVLLTACAQQAALTAPELMEPAVVDVDTAPAAMRELYNIACYEGIVEPEVTEISFITSGVVAEVYVSIGSSVKEGDVLAQLDIKAAQSMADSLEKSIWISSQTNALTNKQSECDIEIAEIELEQLKLNEADPAEIELKEIRIEGLRNAYDSAKRMQWLSLEQSYQQLDMYQKMIDNCTIKATCDGTVLFCTAGIGSWAQANMTVLWIAEDTVSEISCEYIKPELLENAHEVYAISGGERLEITNVPYDRATYLSIVASNQTLKSNFTLNDPEAEIQNGMNAFVYVVSDYVEQALTVPVNAVKREGAEYFVYLMTQEGTQMRKTVKIGVRTTSMIQITEGLEEGDVVYVGN
jgi:macrolide-specific efflux system membrane fusion protein